MAYFDQNNVQTEPSWKLLRTTIGFFGLDSEASIPEIQE